MSRTLRSVLNESNPNKLASAFQSLPAGEALNLVQRSEVVSLVSGVAALSVPAMELISVWGRTTGEYATIDKPETAAPAAGEACVTASGKVAYNRADQTIEVVYLAAEGNIVTETLAASGSAATFLGGKVGVRLLSATVVTGATPGNIATISARGGAPAATAACLNKAGTGVTFNAADVVAGTVTVTYVARPTTSVGAAINGSTNL